MKITVNGIEYEVLTTPEMSSLGVSAYSDHFDELFYLDQHSVIKDVVTKRPIATTEDQLDILVIKLAGLRHLMKNK